MHAPSLLVADYRRSFCVGLTNSAENVEFLSRARSGDEAWRAEDVTNDDGDGRATTSDP